MIKRKWIRRYRELPPFERRPFVIQSWDTASKGGPENDFSVNTTWIAIDNTQWYLVDVFRKRVDYPELKATVRRLAAEYKAHTVLVEDAGAGIPLVQELRSSVSGIVAVKPHRDKESRMAAISAKFEAGQVFLPERAPWLREFEDELFSFPGSRHDDQCDSVSQALSDENAKFPIRISVEVLTRSRQRGFRTRFDGSGYGWGNRWRPPRPMRPTLARSIGPAGWSRIPTESEDED